ncbi:hypothetical protein KR018_002501 [Drosophila ironensis]|nr:hypothetical protein KR018_002501 [Drosophila ironensis]
MAYPTPHDLWRNFFVLSVEGHFGDIPFAARCYLKLIVGRVEAVIVGGGSRKAQVSQRLWINGSLSRDFSKRVGDVQFSKYHWDCHSFEDRQNKFCLPNISSVAIFSIPANAFRSGYKYIFTLNVSRDSNPNVSSQRKQVVSMTDSEVLQIVIECTLNCQMDYIVPDSEVHFSARCSNCGDQDLKYNWYIDSCKTMDTKDLIMYLGSMSNNTRIELNVSTADGRHGRDLKVLTRNPGPSNGYCFVNPSEGHEGLTPFIPCCRNFFTLNSPIEYWYYAGPVLLDSCFDCSCEVYLPITKFIKVMVCDVFSACHPSWIRVNVTALDNIPVDSPKKLWKYITKAPYNIQNLAEQGHFWRYLQIVQSVASRINHVDSALILLSTFKGYHPFSQGSLGKLANITLTLAHRLKPIRQKEQAMLTFLVRKMNNNFEQISEDDRAAILLKRPFKSTANACKQVYEIMKGLCRSTAPPRNRIYHPYFTTYATGKMNQPYIDRLTDKIRIPRSKNHNFHWPTTWETQRLHQYLGYARTDNPSLDIEDLYTPNITPSLSFKTRCMNIKDIPKKFSVKTGDSWFVVYFTKEILIQFAEVQRYPVCVRIIGQKRILKWWYPTERMPSLVILSVRVYQKEDKFRREIKFKKGLLRYRQTLPELNKNKAKNSPLTVRDHPSHSHNWAGVFMNCLEEGSFAKMQDVSMYRTLLAAQSVVAIHIVSVTHDMQVKMTTGSRPLFYEVASSNCIVRASNSCKILLLRNNCNTSKRVFIAMKLYSNSTNTTDESLLSSGGAYFAFAFQLRFCDTWIYSLPADQQFWNNAGCIPSMDVKIDSGLLCICDSLSSYTAFTHFVPAVMVPVDPYVTVDLNYYLIVFYLVTMVFLLIWIVWFIHRRNFPPNRAVMHRLHETEDHRAVSKRRVHDLVIHIKTGGRVNAETTASVQLGFYSLHGHEVTIGQDPEHIHLCRNTTYTMWLKTRDIRIPTKLFVTHDNGGRFPSWFLRRIEINDLQTQEVQVFVARRWITHTHGLILSSDFIFKQGETRKAEVWRRRFKVTYERLWNNWGLWQPVTGEWRDSYYSPNVSQAKRFCIFICQLVVNFTACALYFGLTTRQSKQLTRSRYLAFQDIGELSIICCMLDVFLKFFMESLVRRFG